MRPFFVLISFFLGITSISYAQIVKDSTFSYHYDYTTIVLDSTYDANLNPKLSQYVAKKRDKMTKVMNEVIGRCEEPLNVYAPASPLSNLLTDMLLQEAPSYSTDTDFRHCDVAMLNFGGIRASIDEGNITIGDVYAVSPFDNYVVFAVLKGAELKKVFMRFTEKDNEPYAGAQVIYRNGKPVSVTVAGKPIEDTKLYRLVTLNFILEGGDGILSDIRFEKKYYTPVIFRDFLIQEIKKMTQKGKTVQSGLDQRVIMKIDL